MTEVVEVAMTDQQWSMGQDWSEPPAASGRLDGDTPGRPSIPGRPRGHRRDGRGLAGRARVHRDQNNALPRQSHR